MGWDGIHKESKWLEFAADRTLSGAPAPPLPSNVAQGSGKPQEQTQRLSSPLGQVREWNFSAALSTRKNWNWTQFDIHYISCRNKPRKIFRGRKLGQSLTSRSVRGLRHSSPWHILKKAGGMTGERSCRIRLESS